MSEDEGKVLEFLKEWKRSIDNTIADKITLGVANGLKEYETKLLSMFDKHRIEQGEKLGVEMDLHESKCPARKFANVMIYIVTILGSAMAMILYYTFRE